LTNETFEIVRLARLLVAALETFIPEAIPKLRGLHQFIVSDDGGEGGAAKDRDGETEAQEAQAGEAETQDSEAKPVSAITAAAAAAVVEDWVSDLQRDKTLLGKLADKAEAHGKKRDDDEEKGVQATAGRKADAESLQGEFRAVASDFVNNHGRDSLRIFGLDGAPHRNPKKLAVQVETAHDRLLDETIPAPPVLRGRKAVNRTEAAQGLQERLPVLKASILVQDKAKTVATGSGVRNRQTNKLLRRVYIYVGRRSEESFRMVGLHELADRLREVRKARPAGEGTSGEGEGEGEGQTPDGQTTPDAGTPPPPPQP
jgi:hypothetical protein